MAYTVPPALRAEYKNAVRRANRRIISNIDYIQKEGITDNAIKTKLVMDYGQRRSWKNTKTPLSSSIKFKTEKDFKDYMRHVGRWAGYEGATAYVADPKDMAKRGRESIYKSIYGLMNNKGISLEEWRGDLPPDVKKEIDKLSLQQISKFYDYTDLTGEDDYFDSDQVTDNTPEDALEYIRGRLSAVKKFYPTKRKKRKTRRKTKGRK